MNQTTTEVSTVNNGNPMNLTFIFVLLLTVFFPLCQGLSIIMFNVFVTRYDAVPIDKQANIDLENEYDKILDMIRQIPLQEKVQTLAQERVHDTEPQKTEAKDD